MHNSKCRRALLCARVRVRQQEPLSVEQEEGDVTVVSVAGL